jgi:hypothetical protein
MIMTNNKKVLVSWNSGELAAKPVTLNAIKAAGEGELALAVAILGLGLEGAMPPEVWAALVNDHAELPISGKWGGQVASLVGSTRVANALQHIFLAERQGVKLLDAWLKREVRRRREPSLSGLISLLPSSRNSKQSESPTDRAIRFLESQLRLEVWVRDHLKREVPLGLKVSQDDLEWYKKKVEP